MARLLCLDLGTKMGYAIALHGKLLMSATRQDKPSRYSGGGMRFLQFRRWLTEIWDSTQFDCVYFEEVRNHKGVDAAHVYGGMLAMLTSWCEEKKIPYEGIPVGTIKKAACGKGNAGKGPIIAAMAERWGKPLGEADDNEADALAILHWALLNQPPDKIQRQPRRSSLEV